MATRQITRNIALTPHLDAFVQDKVDSGRYQTASEVVREGLRLLEERDQARENSIADLRNQIEIGWQQSERNDVVDGPSVFNEIKMLSKSRRSSGTRKK